MKVTKWMADRIVLGIFPEHILDAFDRHVDEVVGVNKHITAYGEDCRPVFFQFIARQSQDDLAEMLKWLNRTIKRSRAGHTREFYLDMYDAIEKIHDGLKFHSRMVAATLAKARNIG